jgi:hypothetical protein
MIERYGNPSIYNDNKELYTHVVIHNGDRYHFWMTEQTGVWHCRVFYKNGPYAHQSSVNNYYLIPDKKEI